MRAWKTFKSVSTYSVIFVMFVPPKALHTELKVTDIQPNCVVNVHIENDCEMGRNSHSGPEQQQMLDIMQVRLSAPFALEVILQKQK